MSLRTAIVPKNVYAVTNDPASIAAGATANISLSCKGAKKDSFFLASSATLEAGLLIGQAYCTTADSVTVRVANVTSGAINPASAVFNILEF
jgi:formyltetrahydrofolate synthetase